MPKPISRKELVRRLKTLGFTGHFSGGRHEFMKRGKFRIVIPNPHEKDIGRSLLSQIIRDINIAPKEFENL